MSEASQTTTPSTVVSQQLGELRGELRHYATAAHLEAVKGEIRVEIERLRGHMKWLLGGAAGIAAVVAVVATPLTLLAIKLID